MEESKTHVKLKTTQKVKDILVPTTMDIIPPIVCHNRALAV